MTRSLASRLRRGATTRTHDSLALLMVIIKDLPIGGASRDSCFSCCHSGHFVCGAKYRRTLIPNPLVSVNFGSSRRIVGGRCSLHAVFLSLLRSWRRSSEHKQDIVMHLGVKTYLKCLRGFQRKHLNVGSFFPAAASSVLHPHAGPDRGVKLWPDVSRRAEMKYHCSTTVAPL